MTPARPSWAALVGAAWSLATPGVPLAQATATVDLSVSTVRYDGFLSSGAAAVAPSLKWERPGGSLSAQGTYLRFESGNESLQGLVTASLFTPPARRWRGELSASAGASSYADFASFQHALAETRLHYLRATTGWWIGGSAGGAWLGGSPRPVTTIAAGAWARHSGLTLLASAGRSLVGDTAYTDIQSSARLARGRLLLEGAMGARLWSRGGGRGVFGEGSATYTLNAGLALVASGGRYPTDPVRGNVSGRYASVAVRLHTFTPQLRQGHDPTEHSASSPAAARLEVLSQDDRAVRLIVRAPGASLVEIAGDFTDWQAVVLGQTSDGAWEAVFRIASGVHRIDVRIDGAQWTVPAGATVTVDDFGGQVGIFVVP